MGNGVMGLGEKLAKSDQYNDIMDLSTALGSRDLYKDHPLIYDLLCRGFESGKVRDNNIVIIFLYAVIYNLYSWNAHFIMFQ